MKKLLFLLPVLIGGAMLTGCVEETVVTTGPSPAYYGDPYYVYGGVQYYYVGGQYFYYRNNHRYYVTSLPTGGSYWRGHGNYHGTSQSNVYVNKYDNTNVHKQGNVYVNKYDNTNVNKQNKVYVNKYNNTVPQQNAVQANPNLKKGNPNGKKYHKGDKNDNQQHP